MTSEVSTPASTAPAVLILAAGRGTRMKSDRPKVLHKLMGRPLLEHVLNAALYLNPAQVAVITGFGTDEVEQDAAAFMRELPETRRRPQLLFIRQMEQKGTGHAVAMAQEALGHYPGPLLIMCGDAPLISPNTLDGFLAAHRNLAADLSVLTVTLADPAAYGRIIRDQAGWLERIVEFRDADEDERRVAEINSGLYLAEAGPLFQAIERLRPVNNQGEYYLTDVVADFRAQGLRAAAVEIPGELAYEVRGINDRYELAGAQAVVKDRLNEAWMRAGVTMLDPLSTFIEAGVRLAPEVTLWPGVILTGHTVIGPGAEIGPYTRLHNCRVAPAARVPAHQDLADLDYRNEGAK
ncbi:MAG: NTP transferase domain-containing protein [Candidatus Adiutrix sp.]|jgi:bifunctional UDP-N-acetylglucosamine pyrophosphorylase/glucosamine-1-phosphate N-acetyltransferase|nr:NTP transferase domain-containing protein [Candidatus Adiutrix sp.]